jgi:hypothetical protein
LARPRIAGHGLRPQLIRWLALPADTHPRKSPRRIFADVRAET